MQPKDMKPDDLCLKIENHLWSKCPPDQKWDFACLWGKCACKQCSDPDSLVLSVMFFPEGKPETEEEFQDTKMMSTSYRLHEVQETPNLERWCDGVWGSVMEKIQ